MHAADLERLRRFCLAIGLILITYFFADVKVDASKNVSFAGLPLTILRPELIPIGLLIASFYNAMRFWYYGFASHRSPRKKRRQILDSFVCQADGTYKLKSYLTVGELNELENKIEQAFPHFRKARPVLARDCPGGVTTPKFSLPFRITLAGWFEDLDYAAPVWLNLIAVGLVFARYLTSKV